MFIFDENQQPFTEYIINKPPLNKQYTFTFTYIFFTKR
jgi:hypothetical protein